MALLFWDASALVKRYFVEVGSETVDALLASAPRHELATTPWDMRKLIRFSFDA